MHNKVIHYSVWFGWKISKPGKWLPFSFVSTICRLFDFFVTSLSIANILVELEGSNGLLMSWLLRFSYFCQYNVKTLGNKTISLRSWQWVCIWRKEHAQNTSCVHDFLSLLVNLWINPSLRQIKIASCYM